ncbi:MAG: hypothetical protein HY664_00515 [Chloroflexi bacterium]|nr:hypothetical protein [Chloroflexota bacterium]
MRQFSNLAFAKLSPKEKQIISQHLNPAQQGLFYAMPGLSQRHCLNVYQSLIKEGHQEDDLLQTALLHDVGKVGVSLWVRVFSVIVGAISSTLLLMLAKGPWGRGLAANLHHPQLGADLIAATGASPSTVYLIRNHQAKESRDPRLLAFQRADGAH